MIEKRTEFVHCKNVDCDEIITIETKQLLGNYMSFHLQNGEKFKKDEFAISPNSIEDFEVVKDDLLIVKIRDEAISSFMIESTEDIISSDVDYYKILKEAPESIHIYLTCIRGHEHKYKILR